MVKPTPPSRPYNDVFLENYSAEHLWYEIDMLVGIGKYLSAPTIVGGSTLDDARRINNLLVEGFGIHIRNIIDFLYLDRPQPADIIASDFCPPGAWDRVRPPISSAFTRARTRANKELAHLTTARIAGAVPEKKWDTIVLLNELKPMLKLWLNRLL